MKKGVFVMLNAEQSEVVETTMVAYDAIFSELGPEARTAFRDTVEEQLTSGLDIPEVHAVSQATYYSNWNFGLVNGLRAKIAGEDLAEDDEDNNQAANIAEFVAKDLKIAAKIAAAIEQQYSDVTKTVNNTQHINTLTGQLIDDIDKLEADIGILQSDVARYNDPQSPDYDTALAQKAQKDLNTKTTLLDGVVAQRP
ncbi:hypothetical protein [Leisingera sp. S232]|uniref:hypothetical protein n=1 Tax=Leisingera sp. S232 TaxID=3415132 RepID=UPI003C7B71F0